MLPSRSTEEHGWWVLKAARWKDQLVWRTKCHTGTKTDFKGRYIKFSVNVAGVEQWRTARPLSNSASTQQAPVTEPKLEDAMH